MPVWTPACLRQRGGRDPIRDEDSRKHQQEANLSMSSWCYVPVPSVRRKLSLTGQLCSCRHSQLVTALPHLRREPSLPVTSVCYPSPDPSPWKAPRIWIPRSKTNQANLCRIHSRRSVRMHLSGHVPRSNEFPQDRSIDYFHPGASDQVINLK